MQSNEITGKIVVSKKWSDDEGRYVPDKVEWQGDDVIGVTPEFIEDADPAFAHRDGDILTLGPYKVRMVKLLPPEEGGYWLCVRIDGDPR